MSYKSITTILTDLGADKVALDAACAITRQFNGHLDALCLGVDRTQPGFYYAGANAMAVQSNLAIAEESARNLETDVKDYLNGSDFPWATNALAAQSAGLAQFLAYHTRFSDLAVFAKPYGEERGHEHEAIVESALFDAQIPVVVTPDKGAFPTDIRKVVVAWNESRESLRAIRAALPILTAADQVNVAIIDPPAHAPNRSDPGGALSQMLARHGARAEVSVLARTMPRVSDVIARHVEDMDADLLVMGAYGHSRFRESILGGATRNLLQTTEVPLLMAH